MSNSVIGILLLSDAREGPPREYSLVNVLQAVLGPVWQEVHHQVMRASGVQEVDICASRANEGILLLLNLRMSARTEGVSLTPLGFDSCDQSTDSLESGMPRLPTGEVAGKIRPECPAGKTIHRPRSQSKGGISALDPSRRCKDSPSSLLPRTISLRCTRQDAADSATWALFDLLEARGERDDDGDFPDTSTSNLSVCRTEVANSVRGCSQLEVHVFLRAISFVAVTFRSLSARELFAAVMNTFDRPQAQVRMSGLEIMFDNVDDLMRLCSRVLETHEDGSVDFSSSVMRRFLLESEFLEVRQCHETVTRTCLQHIQQTEALTVLRPWAGFWRQLTEAGHNHFFNYARKYWPRHYRLAETDTNDLPNQLHGMVELAIVAEHPREEGYLNIEIRRLTLEACFNLSKRYGFEILEKYCRRGGADGTGQSPTFGLISDRQVYLCMKHSRARSQRYDRTTPDPDRSVEKQVTTTPPISDRGLAADSISASGCEGRILSSQDGWVLIRSCDFEDSCDVASGSGQCVECLTAEFRSVELDEVLPPVRTTEKLNEIVQGSFWRSVDTILDGASDSNASDVQVPMREGQLSGRQSPLHGSLDDWQFVDRVEVWRPP